MFKMYYAAAVDCSVDQGKYTLKILTDLIFKKFPEIEVCGAGIGESPIISTQSTKIFKKAIVAYDLRKLRECDILLMVTDGKTYCAGTHMEVEYARSFGMLIIVYNMGRGLLTNIFLETTADKIVNSIEQLEEVLRELV